MHGRNPILIVDDNDDEAIFITRSFAKNGLLYPVIFLGNGHEAID